MTQTKLLCGGDDDVPNRAGRHPSPLMGKGQLIAHIQGEKLVFRILKKGAHIHCNFVDVAILVVPAGHADLTLKRPVMIVGDQPVDQTDQGRFAATAHTSTQDSLSLIDPKGYIVHGFTGLERIGVGYIFQTDHGICSQFP